MILYDSFFLFFNGGVAIVVCMAVFILWMAVLYHCGVAILIVDDSFVLLRYLYHCGVAILIVHERFFLFFSGGVAILISWMTDSFCFDTFIVL